jgi:DNA-directed RNA polymerase specialized sigma24 family protein
MNPWHRWLHAAQAGDSVAREHILREMEPLVQRLASQAQASTREDLAQELRLELWKGIDAFAIRSIPSMFGKEKEEIGLYFRTNVPFTK